MQEYVVRERFSHEHNAITFQELQWMLRTVGRGLVSGQLLLDLF